MSLLMSLSRMNRARSFTVPSCLCFIPPCAAPQSLLHSPSPFAADESTGPRLISAQSLFPSSHTRLHVRNLILARAHVGEDRLPLETANVLGVRLVVSVEVGHHVLEFGWIVLAELAEHEEAAQVQRVAGLVGGLVPPSVEAEAHECYRHFPIFTCTSLISSGLAPRCSRIAFHSPLVMS